MYLANNRNRPPKLLSILVKRQALEEKIQQGFSKKVMVLVAGAGSGKTTVLLKVLDKLPKKNWQWLTIGEDCNYLAIFWSYLLACFEPMLLKEKEAFLEYIESGGYAEVIAEFVLFLTDRLDFDQSFYLILDDFHWIENESMLDSFSLFLANMPENLHVILVTRHQPTIYLSQLLLQQEVQLLGEDDFLLSEQEALEIIDITASSDLSLESKKELLTNAQGWLGGLRLLILSGCHSATFVNLSTLDQPLLLDYLNKEMIGQLNDVQRQFLIETASYPFFFPELVAQILPDVHFSSVLAELKQKNLMVTQLDAAKELYVYHPLLKEYLLILFQKHSTTYIKTVQKKAVEIFYDEGFIDEIMDLLFELQEYERLIEVILNQKNNIHSLFYIGKIPKEHAGGILVLRLDNCFIFMLILNMNLVTS